MRIVHRQKKPVLGSGFSAVIADKAGTADSLPATTPENDTEERASIAQISPLDGKQAQPGPGICLDWLVWQIADSAFPTGGFAHSSGLEAAWQQGEIQSCDELAEFIQAHLAQTGRAALPFLNEAFHFSQPFARLDRLADAFLSNHVANRCSRAQGQAFLFAATHVFALPVLTDFRAKILKEKQPGHFAPVFGFVIRILGISHTLGVRLFLFMALRGLLASAVRLGIAGPMAAQSLQLRLARDAEKVGLRCASLDVSQVAQTSPVLDLLHGAHDRLYSRLFQT